MSGHRTDLSDADILAALSQSTMWSADTVRSFLRHGRPNLKTASIRVRLQRLEREGLVLCTKVKSRLHWSPAP